MTQKEADLEIANRLENYADKLVQDFDITEGKMTYIEYCNLLSALRYAIATLRSDR